MGAELFNAAGQKERKTDRPVEANDHFSEFYRNPQK